MERRANIIRTSRCFDNDTCHIGNCSSVYSALLLGILFSRFQFCFIRYCNGYKYGNIHLHNLCDLSSNFLLIEVTYLTEQAHTYGITGSQNIVRKMIKLGKHLELLILADQYSRLPTSLNWASYVSGRKETQGRAFCHE